MERLWRRLGGDDGGGAAPPVGELFHPIALVALVTLVVNDWWLKGSGAPGWLTGKLSDVAGLLAFPLVVTAAGDCVAWGAARLGARVDFSLRRWKLAGAIAGTAVVFSAIKVWPAATRAVLSALRVGFGDAAIVTDRSDLIALPALAIAWWIGRREIARVPLGRLEYLRRRGSIAGGLADVVACGGRADDVAALERALIDREDARVVAALAKLRVRDRS